jgi:hypothetical protein
MSVPVEDPISVEEVRALDVAGREALVRAAAISALGEVGCQAIELIAPHAIPHLKAINVGQGSPMLVCAVDQKGGIRSGAKGPMTPTELVRELRRDKGINAVGWPK